MQKFGARAAVLRGSNKEVVVKVLKPGVEDILTTDLSFLYLASRVLEFLNPGARAHFAGRNNRRHPRIHA